MEKEKRENQFELIVISVRITATDLCNNGLIGWTEAIAVDKFYDETTYVSVCQG